MITCGIHFRLEVLRYAIVIASRKLKSYPILSRGVSNETIHHNYHYHEKRLNFLQSKPMESVILYKCYNTAGLGICLIYMYSPSDAVHPRALCVYIRQTPRGCVITYTYSYSCITVYYKIFDSSMYVITLTYLSSFVLEKTKSNVRNPVSQGASCLSYIQHNALKK